MLVAAATAAALLLPMLSAQLEVRRTHGFARTPRASALGAAAPGDFWLAPAAPLVPFPGVRAAADPNQRALFPGTLKLALALAGLAWGLRRAETRRFTAFLFALAAGAVALSLLPSARGTAGAARLAARPDPRPRAAAQLLARVDADAGRDGAARGAGDRGRGAGPRAAPGVPAGRRAAGALVIAIAAIASVELWPPAPGLSPAPDRQAWRPWLDWIHQHVPPDAPLVHLPVPASEGVADYEETARAMLLATAHGRPLVNGYSSYFPRGYTAFARIMRGCPPPEAWSALHEVGLRFLSLRSSWLAADPRCGPTEPPPARLYSVGRARSFPELDVEIWRGEAKRAALSTRCRASPGDTRGAP